MNRKEKLEQEQRALVEQELNFKLAIEHVRKVRQHKLNKAELLEIVPANQLERFMQKERERAAVIIQSAFKGYLVRKNMNAHKFYMKHYRAAVCIQRAVTKTNNNNKYLRLKFLFINYTFRLDGT